MAGWLDARAMLEERDAGERGQPVHQLVLEGRVAGFLCGRLPLPVIPVTAAHGGGCVVADGQPRLGEVAHLQVVGCSGAAHLGRDPPWIDGVAEDIWPAARKVSASAVTWSLVSEYALAALQGRSVQLISRRDPEPP